MLLVDVLFLSLSSLGSCRPLMTCYEGALGGDWCQSLLLDWTELLPPPLWLVPTVMIGMLACGS
jgi:hypothetical protein